MKIRPRGDQAVHVDTIWHAPSSSVVRNLSTSWDQYSWSLSGQCCACKHNFDVHQATILSVRDHLDCTSHYVSVMKLQQNAVNSIQGADISLLTTGESHYLVQRNITSLCEFTGAETRSSAFTKWRQVEERGISLSPTPAFKGFSYAASVCRSWIIHDCKIDPLQYSGATWNIGM